ncbi:MAG: DUF4258 domain-containing protein [Clostridiales bacterium]|jgi:hypothetical protein|nr:DUF4258 domain-containing protein [Clostridiales bacterium]
MIDISDIRKFCENNALRWTNHALLRLVKRSLNTDDVVHALMNGVIIEQYPNDYPYPSCLVLGSDEKSQTLHVVCAIGDMELWLITAYRPNVNEWSYDFKSRREASK